MILNGSKKIQDDGGDYLVLVDYLTDGFAVSRQARTLEEALQVIAQDCSGESRTLVRLVRFEVEEVEPNE